MTVTGSMQAWLALEHEAVWLYPVIGARFSALTEPARTSYAAHLTARDTLLARLHKIGVEPVGTDIAYDVGDLDSPSRATAAARRLEQSIAASCLTLAGDARGAERTFANQGLRRAALAVLTWGGKPQAFPGLPAES